ncbi:MAG TPA: hypothetical protein VK178_14305 [Opitutaceae bacterium]|nr:hypothetical protein [Opitutaceae bacterium]
MSAHISISRPTGTCSARRLALIGGLAMAVLWSGCSHAPRVTVDWRGGPFFTPTNFEGVALMPADVRRVAVLPIHGGSEVAAEAQESLQAAARAALLAEGRFEIVAVGGDVVRGVMGKTTLSAAELLPPALFARIAQEYGAEAVLFLEVTSFRPYTPLALGVRAKLVRCDESHATLWSFDTLYDARDPAVANSAKRHASGGRGGLVDPGPAALQSPSRYAAYVFASVFATLPPRPAPAVLPPKSKVPRHRAD